VTTIAANRDEIAADSQGTRESGLIVSYSDRKVRELGPARDIVACQGDEDSISLFEEWYANGARPDAVPDLEENFAALVLSQAGRLFKVYRLCVPVEVREDFIALGSGDEVATGAMAAGASPREAVEIACKYNIWTGGPVVSVSRSDPAKGGDDQRPKATGSGARESARRTGSSPPKAARKSPSKEDPCTS
jgi:ATP-dependent protease HslVU (ClpYQ) peptidase subunit